MHSHMLQRCHYPKLHSRPTHRSSRWKSVINSFSFLQTSWRNNSCFACLTFYHIWRRSQSCEAFSKDMKSTCTTSASGSQSASLGWSAVRISAHVKLKVVLWVANMRAMDLYPQRLSAVKNPAVASAAWLSVLYHQWIPGTCSSERQMFSCNNDNQKPAIIKLHFQTCAVVVKL